MKIRKKSEKIRKNRKILYKIEPTVNCFYDPGKVVGRLRAQNGKNWARSRPVFLKIRNFRIELKTEKKLQITFFWH